MKKILIALGIITVIVLIAISGVFEKETLPPAFSIGQGPGTDIIKPLSVACTPDTGYDICYTNTYGAATATIQSTYWKGKTGYGYIDGANRKYYIDEVYVDVKYRGDKLYKSSSTSWISCGSSGCSASIIPSGKVVLATSPASSIPPVQFTAWDKFTSTSGAWYYSYVQFGWLSSTDAYVLDCYHNTDCGSGSYCDKIGSWDTWTCKVDPCTTMPTPENICDDFDLYSQKCVYGDIVKDRLIEEKSSVCGYVCTEGETISFTCTDGTVINTQECVNNVWIDTPIESCPLNWVNLEMILTEYVKDIKLYLENLL